MDFGSLIGAAGISVSILGGILGWYIRSVAAQLKSLKIESREVRDISSRQEADIRVLFAQRAALRDDLNRIEKKVDRLLEHIIMEKK